MTQTQARAGERTFFANRQNSLVAPDACDGAYHWARTLQALGHGVKLLPAKHICPFVLRDKTDAHDAQAIWVAAQQPHIKVVPLKSEQQQACLTLHRMRAQLMKMRSCKPTRCVACALRVRHRATARARVLLKRVQDELAKAQEQTRLPRVVVASVQDQLCRIDSLQDDIDQLDKRLASMLKQNQQM